MLTFQLLCEYSMSISFYLSTPKNEISLRVEKSSGGGSLCFLWFFEHPLHVFSPSFSIFQRLPLDCWLFPLRSARCTRIYIKQIYTNESACLQLFDARQSSILLSQGQFANVARVVQTLLSGGDYPKDEYSRWVWKILPI